MDNGTRVQHTDTLAWGTFVRMDGADAIIRWDNSGLSRLDASEVPNLRTARPVA